MPNRKNIILHNRLGFTLIELAIVLVIVGLLVGVGSSMVSVLIQSIKVRETRDSADANIQAIISYASGNNHIADLTTTAAQFTAVAKSPTDSWGRNFLYLYDCRFASINPSATDSIQCTGAQTAFTKDTICGRNSTYIKLATDQGQTINNVVYVVLSMSDDAAVNTTLTGTFNDPTSPTTASNPAQLNNSLIPKSGFITPTSGNTATITMDTNNSDIVRWVTLDELRSKIGCQGSPLKIVNNELPYGYNNVPYSVNINADGGVPFTTGGKYSWCLQASSGDALVPASITFKSSSTGTPTIPFQSSCSSGVAVQSDYLVIGGTPVIPTVTGTDSNVYICTQGNVAATATNKPITGTNYSKYWQQAATGTTASATWTPGNTYFPAASNSITVYVYDSVGNIQNKQFVFSINP